MFLTAVYVALLWVASKEAPLEFDDPNAEVLSLPMPGPTARSGLHFILPVVVLVWSLMVDRLSPGLSAFWATAYMIFILLTQRPLTAMMRGNSAVDATVGQGFKDLISGLETGARNMIGIGIATATAGIIVGAVSQTGVGSALADVVEVLSGGNILAILFLTAVLSLIPGMGLPTTANYIVVSALLAPVIVTLGQQNGLIVPLIAVHLFVFYFGIMADVTPPVGLASFAAAAVSGGDPIKTGVVAFFYSLRTVDLPFLFIFNTELLLIDVTAAQGVFVFIVATIAMLLFAAATQGYFLTKNRFYESIALLLIAFTLFRPGFRMDMVSPPYSEEQPAEIAAAALATPVGEERLTNAGIVLREDGDALFIDDVTFGSSAADAGLDWDQKVLRVLRPLDQPSKYLMFLPALLALGGVVMLQRRRARRAETKAAAAWKENDMFKTVLLTLDLNATASWQKALPQAIELVRAPKGKLHILSVVPDMGTPLVESFFPEDFEEKAVDAAAAALDDLVKDNVPEDIAVKQHLAFGKIHKKVLKTIEETNSDLVIMASHKPDRVREFLVGSNADRVVRRSPISVLVVRA